MENIEFAETFMKGARIGFGILIGIFATNIHWREKLMKFAKIDQPDQRETIGTVTLTVKDGKLTGFVGEPEKEITEHG